MGIINAFTFVNHMNIPYFHNYEFIVDS